ncbi:hypothetical protein B0H17DRAFT_1142638 [Mycena rosella]|uniref:Uncharacterized protein n=1 Tax=Mycena rosella TaxID=1033263 RepID=A0AAD7CX28_MYCRO|nr:hypothetical protein B0H17DRAFT_1142638 [Mycena rosella]
MTYLPEHKYVRVEELLVVGFGVVQVKAYSLICTTLDFMAAHHCTVSAAKTKSNNIQSSYHQQHKELTENHQKLQLMCLQLIGLVEGLEVTGRSIDNPFTRLHRKYLKAKDGEQQLQTVRNWKVRSCQQIIKLKWANNIGAEGCKQFGKQAKAVWILRVVHFCGAKHEKISEASSDRVINIQRSTLAVGLLWTIHMVVFEVFLSQSSHTVVL